MLIIIQKNLVGLGRSFLTDQIAEVDDIVAAEWCRIGYAKPAPASKIETAISKNTTEKHDGNTGSNTGVGATDRRANNPIRSKKPS